ncbi:MAG: FAD binding domain-containing protein, partial [Candidatus Rokubacteria bacterium]|nr:FAD binding domain-containing protein [Candidatus Rokubacteria bacterium]
MKPAPFDYVATKTVAEAVAALARGGDDAKVLAGGQSLVPMLNMRLARPTLLVDVNDVSELEYIRIDGAGGAGDAGALAVGALVRQAALARWAAERSPLLAEVFRWIGHAAIRNRGTVAGSIVHADPAAELPAVLLACDGAVVARSARGERTVAARDLYLAPLTTSLAADELVTDVRLTLPPRESGWGFAEVARRH